MKQIYIASYFGSGYSRFMQFINDILDHPKRESIERRVEIDTVSIFVDGLKRYLLTAIDLPTRFAFAFTYKSSSSANARDFLEKLRYVAPFQITGVQTDNGGEFQKHFAHPCQETGLVDFYNYPRHPPSNPDSSGLPAPFRSSSLTGTPTSWMTQRFLTMPWWNPALRDSGITPKSHTVVRGKLPPLRYYLDNFLTPQKSNMLWTLTSP